MSRCNGRRAYEVFAGLRLFRIDKQGRKRYKWKCQLCGTNDEGDGEAYFCYKDKQNIKRR
jgi:hypothetical protein